MHIRWARQLTGCGPIPPVVRQTFWQVAVCAKTDQAQPRRYEKRSLMSFGAVWHRSNPRLRRLRRLTNPCACDPAIPKYSNSKNRRGMKDASGLSHNAPLPLELCQVEGASEEGFRRSLQILQVMGVVRRPESKVPSPDAQPASIVAWGRSFMPRRFFVLPFRPSQLHRGRSFRAAIF